MKEGIMLVKSNNLVVDIIMKVRIKIFIYGGQEKLHFTKA